MDNYMRKWLSNKSIKKILLEILEVLKSKDKWKEKKIHVNKDGQHDW